MYWLRILSDIHMTSDVGEVVYLLNFPWLFESLGNDDIKQLHYVI